MSRQSGFPEPPRKVEEGLKVRSKRGDIARTWWSRRFIEVLESFNMSGRLQRGKRYARSGQILSMTVSTSIVAAQVQGSRATPYRARIGVKAFDSAEWASIESALAERALYAAKLLAGEMPAGVEDVFAELGLELFPRNSHELTMDCSCPDWEIPCKHLAATCYLLAESFDEDPFQLLAWRGRGREELLDHLRALRGTAAHTGPSESDAPQLEECLDSFWSAPSGRAPVAPTMSAGSSGTVLDQLGPPPITVRGSNIADLLRPAYHAMRTESD